MRGGLEPINVPLFQLRDWLRTLPPPIPCPKCGGLPFTVEGAARKCWACGHTWNPGAEPALVTSPPAPPQAPESAGQPRNQVPGPGPHQEAGSAPANPRAAVLVPDGLIRPNLELEPVNTADAAQVFETAARLGYRQIWVGPSMLAHLKFPPAFTVPPAGRSQRFRWGLAHPWLDRAQAYGWAPSTEPPGLSPWLGLTRGETWVDLVIAPWTASVPNPFRGAKSPAQLLGALARYSQALGLRYRRTPGATGAALMLAVHSGPGATPLPEGTPAPPAILEAQDLKSEPERHYVADELGELREGYLHAFDINGMYLAACSSVELGFGQAAHVKAPAFDAQRPGYWRALIKGADTWVAPYPRPFVCDGKPHWYTTPMLELALDLGATVKIREAWIYPQHHRWFEPWYERLRDARSTLMRDPSPEGRLALAAVKATYAQALGRLAGRWLQAGDETFRPDWRHAVVSRARANMERHLAKATAPPVALDIDLAVFHSIHQDPGQAAAALGLQVSAQLGKWKWLGSLSALAAGDIVRGARTRSGALGALLAALRA